MNVDGNTQILKNERLLLLYRRVATCKVVVEPTEGRCCAEVRFVVHRQPASHQNYIALLSLSISISEDDMILVTSGISSKLADLESKK